eukprot:scaffold243552_cov32-Tisochrysis_lutea.AAC.4
MNGEEARGLLSRSAERSRQSVEAPIVAPPSRSVSKSANGDFTHTTSESETRTWRPVRSTYHTREGTKGRQGRHRRGGVGRV